MRKLIKEVFKVSVRKRILIEGGRGNFIDSSKNDSPLIPLLAPVSFSSSVDLTGILSLKCRVSIIEPEEVVIEDKKKTTNKRISIIEGMTSVASTAMGMLISKSDIRYEDSFTMCLKTVTGYPQRPLYVGSLSGFAGAYTEMDKQIALTVLKWKSTGKAETVVTEDSSPHLAHLNVCT